MSAGVLTWVYCLLLIQFTLFSLLLKDVFWYTFLPFNH